MNNKGYSLLLLERYEESIPLFDKAIFIDKDFSYSYNNRGLAKIKLNLAEEGREDIEKSLELDSGNAHAYRNLGIYYDEKGDYDQALNLFLKAKELDPKVDSIGELIDNASSGCGMKIS